MSLAAGGHLQGRLGKHTEVHEVGRQFSSDEKYHLLTRVLEVCVPSPPLLDFLIAAATCRVCYKETQGGCHMHGLWRKQMLGVGQLFQQPTRKVSC